MEKTEREILLELQGQVKRLVSDAESEKKSRRYRNIYIARRMEGYEKTLRILEDDKLRRETTLKNIKVGWAAIGLLLGAAISSTISYILKYLPKH